MSLKRVFAAAMAVLMVFATLPAVAFGAPEPVKVKITQNKIVHLDAGGTATLSLKIENVTGETLKNIRIVINNGLSRSEVWADSDENGTDIQACRTVKTLNPDESVVRTFTLHAAPGCQRKVVNLDVIALQGSDAQESVIGENTEINVQLHEAGSSSGGSSDPDTARTYPVQIDNESRAPVLYQGLYFRTITLRFDFSSFAEDQYERITATVGQPDAGVELENMEYQEYLLEDGERNSRILRIRARALPSATPGYYTIPITITAECNQDYVAPDGSSVYEYQLKTYVNVESSDSDSVTDFYINKYEVDHEDIQYGDQFNFTVNVVNTGSEDLENLQVRLDGFSTDGLTLVDDTDVKYINVDAGEEAQLTYRMEASERIGTGRYPLTVAATYAPKGTAGSGETAENHSETITAFIKVTGDQTKGEDGETVKQEKPVIIIESYTYGGENVTFGSEFPLTMVLRNTSSSATIRNLKVTLGDDSGVFNPTKSSNTFYVQNIGPGASVEKTVEFMAAYPVNTESGAKSYSINVSYEYEAMSGGELMDNSFSSNEVLSIPLVHTDRFSVGELYVDSQTYVGQQSFVNLSFINEGKSTVYNLSVQMEGTNMTISDGNYYVGNMQSGTQDSFEAYFTPMEAGPVTGTIVFTYEDANNAAKEIRKEFTTEAIGFSDPMMDGEMDMPVFEEIPEESQGMSPVVIVVICVAAAAVLGGGAFVVFRVLKKRRSSVEDEDL